MPLQIDTQVPPSFIIRDLDKDPHGPRVPSKSFDSYGQAHNDTLLTPIMTPDSSPKLSSEQEQSMTRSASDLSNYSVTSYHSISRERSSSALSQSSRTGTSFPFTSIFKWKRSVSSTSGLTPNGLQTPPMEDHTSSDYFANPTLKNMRGGNLDNLGQSLQAQRTELNTSMEQQLQEERRLRHLAEDRLTEVEEEVTRLCTVMLPTDTGETGEAYFASILQSVRLAIDSYEERTKRLEKEVEEKAARLISERRDRTNAEIDCTTLKNQLKLAQAQLAEAQVPKSVSCGHEDVLAHNKRLQEEVDQFKAENSSTRAVSTDGSELDEQDENETLDRASLLQKVKDTEAQRDALRHVSRGLRQRLTIEQRKNAERSRALAAIDSTIAARGLRSSSRQSSYTNLFKSGETGLDVTLSADVDALKISARPRLERFVTALEVPVGQRVVTV